MGAATDLELLARAVRNPGRLCLNPLSTSESPPYVPNGGTGEFPFGGTSLGFFRDGLEIVWDVSNIEGRDPASGAMAEVIERYVGFPRLIGIGEGPAWDEDLLAQVFSATTPTADLPIQSPPETAIQGTLNPRVVPAWGKLLWKSDDANGKCVVFRRPLALLQRASTWFALKKKAGLPVYFLPTPDTAWATTPFWQIAHLGNLNLGSP